MNTQDLFHAVLIPAILLLSLCIVVTCVLHRRGHGGVRGVNDGPPVTNGEILIATLTTAGIVVLLAAVALGYLYAVEAAACGVVALLLCGWSSGVLTMANLKQALQDAMAVTGALFALLVAATTFTLVVRAFGTDRWIAAGLSDLGGGAWVSLAIVLGGIALCALVLDAFEMIFVVVPLVMPPLLVQVPDAAWAAVLVLLVLQTSFMVPPFGYSLMMVRNRTAQTLRTAPLTCALAPYLAAQLLVVALVLAFPGMLWKDATLLAAPPAESPKEAVDINKMLNEQLEQNRVEEEKQK